MKKHKFLTAIAAASLALSAMVSQAALVNYNPGDLVVAFTTNAGTGAGQTVLLDLGDVTTLRDLNTNNFALANIGSILDGTFGIGAGSSTAWYDRTDLYWGAVALYSSSRQLSVREGDPDLTIYASKSRPSVGSNSTAWSISLSGNRSTTATLMSTMLTTFAGQTADGSNANVAIETSSSTSWDHYNPPVTSNASFTNLSSTGVGIEQKFAAGSYGTVGGNAVEGMLDIYRILDTTTGASPGGSVGVGSRIGSLTVDSTGEVGFVAAVPEPSTWALIGLGLFSVLIFRRRSQHSQAA